MSGRPLVHDWAGAQRATPALARRSEWRALRLTLMLVDTAAIATTFGLAYVIHFNAGRALVDLPRLGILVLVWLVAFGAHRLYDFQYLLNGLDEYVRTAQATSLGTLAVIVFSFLEPSFVIVRGWLLLAWIGSTIGAIAGRYIVRRIVHATRRRGRFATPILIIGANEEGRALAEQLHESLPAGLRVVGFLDDRVDKGREVAPGLRVLGAIDEAPAWIKRYAVGEVIVAASALTRAELLDVCHAFGTREDVTFRLSSSLFDLLTAGLRIKPAGRTALLTANRARWSPAERLIKKAMDVVIATGMLSMLSPLMLGLALLVKLDSPGPALRRRRVLGTRGKTFNAFEFRTTVVRGNAILARHPELARQPARAMERAEDPRVTRSGKWLRRFGLAELPRLFNVLLGQMSLVGPRTITPEEAEHYGPWRMNLLTVKPGLVGVWPLGGHQAISYREQVQVGLCYIRNYSTWLDLILLARTLLAVFKKIGENL